MELHGIAAPVFLFDRQQPGVVFAHIAEAGPKSPRRLFLAEAMGNGHKQGLGHGEPGPYDGGSSVQPRYANAATRSRVPPEQKQSLPRVGPRQTPPNGHSLEDVTQVSYPAAATSFIQY